MAVRLHQIKGIAQTVRTNQQQHRPGGGIK